LSGKLEAEHCLKPWQAPHSMQAAGPIGAERRTCAATTWLSDCRSLAASRQLNLRRAAGSPFPKMDF
jgi:hypothetical protein